MHRDLHLAGLDDRQFGFGIVQRQRQRVYIDAADAQNLLTGLGITLQEDFDIIGSGFHQNGLAVRIGRKAEQLDGVKNLQHLLCEASPADIELRQRTHPRIGRPEAPGHLDAGERRDDVTAFGHVVDLELRREGDRRSDDILIVEALETEAPQIHLLDVDQTDQNRPLEDAGGRQVGQHQTTGNRVQFTKLVRRSKNRGRRLDQFTAVFVLGVLHHHAVNNILLQLDFEREFGTILALYEFSDGQRRREDQNIFRIQKGRLVELDDQLGLQIDTHGLELRAESDHAELLRQGQHQRDLHILILSDLD